MSSSIRKRLFELIAAFELELELELLSESDLKLFVHDAGHFLFRFLKNIFHPLNVRALSTKTINNESSGRSQVLNPFIGSLIYNLL